MPGMEGKGRQVGWGQAVRQGHERGQRQTSRIHWRWLVLMMPALLLLPMLGLLHLEQDPLGQWVKVGRKTSQPSWHHQLSSLETFPPPEERPVVEHVLGVWVERPEVALARVARLPGHLDEAVVEAEVVPDAVLPGGVPAPVVRKPAADELADAVEGESLVRGLDDGHGDHGNVGVRRLDVLVLWISLTISCCIGHIALLLINLASITDLLLKGVFF